MKIKHDDWKVLPLFTTAVIAGIVSSALLNTFASVQATTISELTIEERLAIVREQLKQRGNELTDLFHSLSLAQDNPEVDSKNKQFNQWTDWNNCWTNWSNGTTPTDWRSWYNC